MTIAKIAVITLLGVILIFPAAQLSASSPWTGKDKPMHLLASTYMVYWNYHLATETFDYSHSESLFLSVSFTSLLGTSKELSDRYAKKTKFSWYDMAYNTAGIALGVAIIHITR